MKSFLYKFKYIFLSLFLIIITSLMWSHLFIRDNVYRNNYLDIWKHNQIEVTLNLVKLLDYYGDAFFIVNKDFTNILSSGECHLYKILWFIKNNKVYYGSKDCYKSNNTSKILLEKIKETEHLKLNNSITYGSFYILLDEALGEELITYAILDKNDEQWVIILDAPILYIQNKIDILNHTRNEIIYTFIITFFIICFIIISNKLYFERLRHYEEKIYILNELKNEVKNIKELANIKIKE